MAQVTTGKLKISSVENLNNSVSKSVGNLPLIAENYPELKWGNNFILFQASWNETKDQIAASRRFNDAAITDYNNAIRMFHRIF